MYVPFGKSVDDVTFRLSLRQLFLPRLKKTMEHNPGVYIPRYLLARSTEHNRSVPIPR